MRTMVDAMKEGQALLDAQKYPQAIRLYDAVVAHEPRSVEALTGLGIAHGWHGNAGTSLGLFALCALMAPDNADVQTNLGLALRRMGHIEAAREHYRKALAANGLHKSALGGMAGSYVNEGNPDPGIVYARRAITADPTNVHNVHNLALLLMEKGEWHEAWKYWPRRQLRGHAVRTYPGDRWRGEDVDWLVIHGEQGLGDEIMFLGCLPELRDCAHGGIIIECEKRLKPLVSASFPRAIVIGSEAEFVRPESGVIAWTPMGDLPQFCYRGIPPKLSGYLKPPLIEGYADAVLLAVAGGTVETHSYHRNPPLQYWAPVVDAIRKAGFRPVCIQYGTDGATMAEAMGVEFDRLAAQDITRQAAVIKSARALVSVQQTALHLGGAVGANVLGIVSRKPAWRYGLSGPMPWYQTVTLYRQFSHEEAWEPVMARVAEAVGGLG